MFKCFFVLSILSIDVPANSSTAQSHCDGIAIRSEYWKFVFFEVGVLVGGCWVLISFVKQIVLTFVDVLVELLGVLYNQE